MIPSTGSVNEISRRKEVKYKVTYSTVAKAIFELSGHIPHAVMKRNN